MSGIDKREARVHVSLALPNGGSLCEADVMLIETIQRCRSILGASKLMGLSYRKTWLMTDALNRTFEFESHRHFPRPPRCGRGADSLRPAARGSVPVGGTAVGCRSIRRDRGTYGLSRLDVRAPSAGRGWGSSSGLMSTFEIATVLTIAQAFKPGSRAKRSTDSHVTRA